MRNFPRIVVILRKVVICANINRYRKYLDSLTVFSTGRLIINENQQHKTDWRERARKMKKFRGRDARKLINVDVADAARYFPSSLA